jgi:OPA family glycerol-3-phosphate transporter-like MFS transporter 3
MFCIGAVNSAMYPSMIAIMGNWFPKKNRGFIVGLWSTCNSAGNTIGIQLAAVLLKVFNDDWPWLFVIVAILVLTFASIMWFFLVPHPNDIGIVVEEMNEKEILMVAATENS